jgi:hypothetical protein
LKDGVAVNHDAEGLTRFGGHAGGSMESLGWLKEGPKGEEVVEMQNGEKSKNRRELRRSLHERFSDGVEHIYCGMGLDKAIN